MKPPVETVFDGTEKMNWKERFSSIRRPFIDSIFKRNYRRGRRSKFRKGCCLDLYSHANHLPESVAYNGYAEHVQSTSAFQTHQGGKLGAVGVMSGERGTSCIKSRRNVRGLIKYGTLVICSTFWPGQPGYHFCGSDAISSVCTKLPVIKVVILIVFVFIFLSYEGWLE